MSRRNINNLRSGQRLSAPVHRALKKAFQYTGCMDLYSGNTVQYLEVIGTSIRDIRAENRKLEARLAKIAKLAVEVEG